jgi:hypothetical protein
MTLLTADVAADTNVQLWSEITLAWVTSHRFTLSADIEPKVLVARPAGDPDWATLDVTPAVEFTHGQWLDVTGDLVLGRTRQSDDLDTTEIRPRVGLRFHILSNLRDDLLKERVPRFRLVIRNFLRFEWRNLYYSTDKPDSSTLRIRDRVETLYPLNKARVTADGAAYLLADAEWFWTEDDLDERFASKERFRAGVGHRRNVRWRVEGLFVWERTRKEPADTFNTSDYAVDLRLKRVW